MLITYDKAFKTAKNITITGAAVLVITATTGCSSGSSSSSSKEEILAQIDHANDGCSSASDYCECMYNDLKDRISSGISNGTISPADGPTAIRDNEDAYAECNDNLGQDSSYWKKRVT